MSEKFQVIELSDKSIEKIAKAVFKLEKKEQQKIKKEYKDRSLHNTKMLLENYKKIKAHCESVRDQLEEDKLTFWDHGFLDLNALLQNRAKAVKMLRYVDIALEKYKIICSEVQTKNKGQMRRYDILTSAYFSNKTIDRIADTYDLDRTTVLRNREEAVKDLSVILFGVDILNDL